MIPAAAQGFHLSSPHAVKLAGSNPEYKAILDVVGNVDHPREGFKFSIESIFRVQNEQLAEEYLLYKQNLSKVLRKEELHEERLYHGTPSIESVHGIINEGFDWRLCGKHGTRYGKGTYFSLTPRYSLHNFTRPDGSGFRYLFVSRVLLGKSFEGNPSMVRPPEGYHCTVDRLPNPRIVVVYHIKQTYPEYLVVLEERPMHDIAKFRSHSFLDNFASQGPTKRRKRPIASSNYKMPTKMAEGYHPKKSQVSDYRLAKFVRYAITGHIVEVPGVGATAKGNLAESDEKIETTYQLIAKYLALKGEGVDCKEHCQRFWLWLKSVGINSNRSGIVLSIAEKVNLMMPGTYDGKLYEEEDEDA